ncbi:D-alanine--D-alanine ligase [Patescibacteria group bacterium]|nr:D-alanine--D-alanine ligase [Patescibacteria group bacterium]MBU4512223.1 D-alanine--D-alanine ligase [Patescibacteria group bacterium]MCG2692641.1 D-alanine--D-alanine ligase [Candidatus Parcubacteria bacterium]
MSKKLRVAILFGGKSAEHEVSLQSAKNVIEAIDKNKYEVVLIGIDKDGRWHLNQPSRFLLNADDPNLIALNKSDQSVAFLPGTTGEMTDLTQGHELGKIDVVFPVLHGTFGEDGTVQGLLKLAEIPFVGASVLGSSVGMDKDVTKRLLRDAGIPIAKFLAFGQESRASIDFKKVKKELGAPLFVKPCNMGSSVGINKVSDEDGFKQAIEDAFKYDNKILIEEYIKGREIECSVLGNENPVASLPGEVIPHHEFYSYEAKYIDENGATLGAPAKLPGDIIQRVQGLAVETFKTLCCEGLARVDFFLKSDGEVVVNELNTLPGFTKISMYPKLWEASGISCTELIDRLIQLAIERFEKEKILKTTFSN